MLEIVTHCYAQQLPHYAGFLRWQLASLVHYRCRYPVSISIIYTPGDRDTMRVVEWFRQYTDLSIRTVALPLPQLGRRAIGRNIRALQTTEDLVWFTDVDHVFGRGCLDALGLMWPLLAPPRPTLIWPATIQINRDHAMGDRLSVVANDLPRPNPENFVPKHYRRAIGGVQIADGGHCRTYGYLDGHSRWQQPTDYPFRDFRDDRAYRMTHDRDRAIELPNLYRLRHSTTTH